MSNYQLLLPKMGESVAEATVIKWLKNPGDHIEADETVLEIATDKVDTEVPSPVAGKLVTQLFNVDDVVQVGTPIAIIEIADTAAANSERQITPAPSNNNVQQPKPAQQPEIKPVEPQQIPGIDQLENKAAAPNKPTPNGNYQSEKFYSPLVKSIAAQEGISMATLDTIIGTGAEGRLTKDDLLVFIKNSNGKQPLTTEANAQPNPLYEAQQPQNFQPLPPQGQVPLPPYDAAAQQAYAPQPYLYAQPYMVYPPMYAPPGYPPQQPVYFAMPPGYPAYAQHPGLQTAPQEQPVTKPPGNGVSVGADDEVMEMDRMRRLIADHMVNSAQTAPHVTSFIEVDVTNLVMWRDKSKQQFETKYGEKLTFTPIFTEAVAQTIKALPMVNVSVNSTQIIKRKHINIGMATALPSGNLIVPVIRNADQKSLMQLAKSVNDLADRARKNKLQPDEIKEGTFTITNIGTFGNLMGTPIINQPQVAIMAIGAIKKKPAVVETPKGDIITIRHMMYLSMSYDHRVVDGAIGGLFIKKVADYLEAWDANKEV